MGVGAAGCPYVIVESPTSNPRMDTMRIFVVLVAALLLTACASSGRPIEQSDLDQIVNGQTTRSELVGMFGRPMGETVNSDGSVILTWAYAYVGFAGIGTKTQGLSVVLGPDGKVVSHTKTGYYAEPARLGR